MADTTEVVTNATTNSAGDPIQKIDHVFSSVVKGEFGVLQSIVPDESKIAHTVMYAVVALLMLVVAYFTAKILARWISGALCRRVDETLGRFAGRFTFYCVLCCAGLGILGTAGINVASLAAVLTAAGFAIGLAFQGTLSNVAAGILLLVFRPFKVGDVVVAGGVTGKVNEIDLFTTTLDTPDNRRLIVPNSAIASATIENITYHPQRRVEVTVGVEYQADIAQTRDVLTQAAESLRSLLIDGEGRGYQVLLTNLNTSSVDWTVRFWTASANVFKVKEALTQEVKTRLDTAGISIPFPQMQLHFPSDLPEPMVEAASMSARVRPRLRHPQADAS